jgi:hypothetical protein
LVCAVSSLSLQALRASCCIWLWWGIWLVGVVVLGGSYVVGTLAACSTQQMLAVCTQALRLVCLPPLSTERDDVNVCYCCASIPSRRSAWCRSHPSMLLKLKERELKRELTGSCCVVVGQWLAAPSCHGHMERCCVCTHACCGACPASGDWGVWKHLRDGLSMQCVCCQHASVCVAGRPVGLGFPRGWFEQVHA